MVKERKKQGFIAIASLLIIAAISMTFAMTVLKDGVDNASASLSSIFYETARINANICFEDTLLRIKKEETFSQNLNYAITEDESCSTVISWQDPVQVEPHISERNLTLEVTGISHDFTRIFSYELRVSRFDVNYPSGDLDYLNNIDILSSTESTL